MYMYSFASKDRYHRDKNKFAGYILYKKWKFLWPIKIPGTYNRQGSYGTDQIKSSRVFSNLNYFKTYHETFMYLLPEKTFE